MSVTRRVFISAPREVRLDDSWKPARSAVITAIRDRGYEPQTFMDDSGGGLAAEQGGWSVQDVEEIARRCVGAVLIGIPFWRTTYEQRDVWLPTDYCQYEGGVAHACGLPILAIAIGIEQRIFFEEHGPIHVASIPYQTDLSWLQSAAFRSRLDRWSRAIDARHDVFLGYSSKHRATAEQIQVCLESEGVKVLNYNRDFKTGRSILKSIEDACASCTAGVFLISEDDRMEGTESGFAPRDNVVFEAGYFMCAKGSERCVIIRQGAAKMPADVGGLIYLPIDETAGIGAIEDRLRAFVRDNL